MKTNDYAVGTGEIQGSAVLPELCHKNMLFDAFQAFVDALPICGKAFGNGLNFGRIAHGTAGNLATGLWVYAKRYQSSDMGFFPSAKNYGNIGNGGRTF